MEIMSTDFRLYPPVLITVRRMAALFRSRRFIFRLFLSTRDSDSRKYHHNSSAEMRYYSQGKIFKNIETYLLSENIYTECFINNRKYHWYTKKNVSLWFSFMMNLFLVL